ncbi:hypothetical protein SAMN05421778_102111 [Sphaerotilus natans]|nr:hypothetical protein SAMN05421778_102111 [Sphaerotilus natans]
MHARAHPAAARLTPSASAPCRRRPLESPSAPPSRLRGKKGWLAGLLIGIALPALAQFDTALPARAPRPALATMATTEAAYRIDGARHLYLNHPERIHDGLLPPFLHAIAGVRTTIDAHGRVSRIEITREPAVAREVLPWIEHLIRAAEPYPRPPAGLDTVRWDEIWLIDRSGRFQLHTLSEGQQQAPDSADDEADEADSPPTGR